MNKTEQERVVKVASPLIGVVVIFLVTWVGLAGLLGHASPLQAGGLAILIILLAWCIETMHEVSR